jgi:hypothetical protein
MLEEAFRQFVVLLLKFKNKFSTNFTFVNLQAFSFVSQIVTFLILLMWLQQDDAFD